MRRSPDMIVLVGLAVAQVGLALLPAGGFARIVFGAPFVLFAPGYAVTAAAWPNNRGHATERVVLSLGLSFCIAVRVGLRSLELAQTTYRVEVLADGNVAIDEPAVTLSPGETWELTVPAAAATGRELEAAVYRGAEGTPYRRVRLAVPQALANQE